jgi:hypothetical protein
MRGQRQGTSHGIDEIKRWQWVVIGLIVGLCLGFAGTSGEPNYDGRLSGQLEFERDLLRKHPKTSDRWCATS